MDPTPIEQTKQFLTGNFMESSWASWGKIQKAANDWTEPQQKVIFGYLLKQLAKGISEHPFFYRFDPRQRPKTQQLANYLFQHFDHLKFNLPLDDFHEIFIKFLFLNNHINILRLVPGRLGQFGLGLRLNYYYFVVSPEALQLLQYGYRYPFVGNNTDRFISTLVRKNKITEQHQPLGILEYFFQQKFEPNPVTQQPLPQLNQPIITEINRKDRARWAMGLIVACITENNQVAYEWLIPRVLARLLRKNTPIVETPPASAAARAKFLRDYLHVKESGSTVFCKTLLRAIVDVLRVKEVTPERQFMLEDVMQRLYEISEDLKKLMHGTETIPVQKSLFKHLFKTTCGNMDPSYQKIIMHATIVWQLNYRMPNCKQMKDVYDNHYHYHYLSRQSVYNCYEDLLVEIKGKSVDEILQWNLRYFSNLFYRAKLQKQQPYQTRRQTTLPLDKRQKPTYTVIPDTNSPQDIKIRNACHHAWAIYYLYHHVYNKTLKNAASWDFAAVMQYFLPIAIGMGWTPQSTLRIFPQRMNASGTHHLIQMNDKTMVSVDSSLKQPVILWDIPSGTKRPSLPETLHKKYAMDKIDENTIAIGNSSGNIMVYDITRKSLPKEYGTKTNIKIQAVLALNDNTLISANYNQTLREWQAGSPRIVGSTNYRVQYLVKISDMVFVAVFFIGSFQIWKKTEDQYRSSGVYKSRRLAALIRWDDTTFITGDKDYNAVYIHKINPNLNLSGRLTTNVTPYPTNIEGVESIVKLSENQMAVATWSGAIRIITRDNGNYRHEDLPTSHDETEEGTYVAMLLFDDNTLITASNHIFVWTLSNLTKKPIVLMEHKAEVNQLIRLNDNAFASSAYNELIIWKGIQNQER